jgi:hypothetical protein
MSSTRTPWSALVPLVALAACSSGDEAAVKPERLHAPPATADLVATRGERESEYFERQLLLVNRWVKRSGIPAGAAAGLVEAARQSRDQTGKRTFLTPDQLVTSLQAWVKAAGAQDSVKRAAAYLVADRVLRITWRPFLLTDPNQQKAQREKLKVMGAESQLSEASGEIEYQGNWLQMAQRLDPTGPMGQRASVILLEADCAGGQSPDAYHSIIQRLEGLVASAADSEVRFTTQILEADAYRDIVALAQGLGKTNADSTKFLPEAEAAKTKAIALYEAALAVDSTSRLARGGKLAHDRLTSGQPLDHVRFFCLGES